MIDRLVATPVALQLVLVTALVARLDILIVVDKAGGPVRSLLRRLGPWGDYLATCPWCIGIWCSIATVAAWVNLTGATLLAGVASTAALAAGYLGALLKDNQPPTPE